MRAGLIYENNGSSESLKTIDPNGSMANSLPRDKNLARGE